jgi:hypothetical protein
VGSQTPAPRAAPTTTAPTTAPPTAKTAPPKSSAVAPKAAAPLPAPAPATQAASKPAVTPAVTLAARPAAAPVVASPAPAPLDLKSLEARLRQTTAIGVMTKLSLKNQVDDLVADFRAYHKRQATKTLNDLRRSYDLLLMKVLSLLQDSDPSLASDISKSRTTIWGILADPRKFTESNLMAGDQS